VGEGAAGEGAAWRLCQGGWKALDGGGLAQPGVWLCTGPAGASRLWEPGRSGRATALASSG